ncbi:Methenyltetrahydrofolate synthase domain-containing protein [Holothuria leucospilota]|uniref:Methenyltetrahydrofolate synthase domain-containing protein n=1 Tax=Holothuria leucospilota TaxID=206669 RepID=A0A9Q1HL84_HOLLE|nr:Methenyltetrahydrofolate synthase domain-containing protein [Holothuria leucospilota]
MDAFKNAKTVKVNPDKPQEQARFLALEANKTLLVPTPRMRRGLFNRVVLPAGANKSQLRECCSFQGIKVNSAPVGIAEKYQVDLVVIGSVAVSETGIRIGKGEGFADLEYAIMSAAGAANEDTVVITTVHDCQVTDIPESLIQPHDLTVDFILTPTRVIKCSGGIKQRPKGIIWSMLTEEKFQSIPVLKELRDKDDEAGIDTSLKPSEDEGGRKRNSRQRNNRRDPRPRRQRARRNRDKEDEPPKEDEENKPAKRTNNRRAPPQCPPGCRIFVGGVTRRTRVSEFKTAIRAKGVYPKRVVWRGARGFCFLEFDVPDKIEDDVTLLGDIAFNNVQLRPQIAIDREEKKDKKAVNGEQNETQGDEGAKQNMKSED